MTINTITYPKIMINSSNVLGNYKKTTWLTQGFITENSSVLFNKSKGPCVLTKPLKTRSKSNGFLLEILFCGFNYANKRVKLYRPAFYCDIHKSEILVCKEKPMNTYKSRIYKRRLLFFSHNSTILNNIENLIKNFRLPNIYTGRGLYSPDDTYKIKKLKKRK